MTTTIRRLLSSSWLAPSAAVFLGILYLLQALYYAHTSNSVLDEGAYLYKGYLFLSGRYWPYQTYGPWTNHMPLSFLIPGVIQVLFIPGLRTGRYFVALVGVLILVGMWILGRRFGGRWWALFAVAVLALNPSIIQFYSMAVSQVLVACLLVWTMVLTLGDNRPLWQVVCGSVLAGLTVATRENMLPFLPLFLFYIVWQHGWRVGILATISSGLVLGVIHAVFWPNIFGVWAGWLPRELTSFLDAFRVLGGGSRVWNPLMPLESRILSFLQGLRVNLISLVGVIGFGFLCLFANRWKNKAYLRAAAYLTVLYATLFFAHTWAALWNNYCVFCYAGYLAFFTPVGIVLVVIVNRAFLDEGMDGYSWFSIILILLVSTAVGYGAFQELGTPLLDLPVPRIREGQLQGGSAPLRAIFEYALSMDLNLAKRILSTLTGLLFAVIFILFVWVIDKKILVKYGWHKNFGVMAISLFLMIGVLLSPTPVLSVNTLEDHCRGDVIAAYEQAGAHLVDLVPPGSKVYWDGGLSVVPMLYLPGVDMYAPQINDGYAYRRGGDAEALLRGGLWNDELKSRWRQEADFIIIEEWRYNSSWKEFVESGEFVELERTVDLDQCENNTGLRIFRRESN